MNEELRLTRRGLVQMVSAIVATASFATRRPLFGLLNAAVATLDAELVEGEALITDHARGTRLEHFLRSRGIRPAHLARESGYSRQLLLGIRLGRVEPTSRCVASLVGACQRLAREAIHARDLFDLSTSGLRAVVRIQRCLND